MLLNLVFALLFALLFPISIFAQSVDSLDKPTCTDEELKLLGNSVNELRHEVVKNIGVEDIEKPIAIIEELTKYCGLTPERFALNKNVFKFWKEKNAQYKADHHAETLADISLSRPLTESESQEYLKTLKTSKARAQGKILIHHLNLMGQKNQIENKELCFPEFDLTEEFGPVKNQGDTEWCASYAVSDLVAFYLKEKVSAIDMALNDKDNLIEGIRRWMDRSKTYNFGGAFAQDVILNSQKAGFCVDPELVAVDYDPPPAFKQTVVRIGLTKYDLGKNVPREKMAEEYSVFRRMFPSARLEDFNKIYAESTANSFIHEARRQTCKKRKSANFEIMSLPPADWRAFNAALSQDSPLALSTSGPFLQRETKMTAVNHVVLVVGRKFDSASNQCQYTIRNSWGDYCGYYPQSRNCLKGTLRISAADLRPSYAHAFGIKP